MEPHSRHRCVMALYDLSPSILMNTYISPNCTIIGEVIVGSETNIWYGVVIRGDINAVRIGSNTSIEENTVITTAGTLPTGIPASVDIGSYVRI